ncbi:MAG: hypothetical protein QGI76_09410, partial [Dehalococcoidia bacterium]|nr:hypothetical protein [Dehalococcoidia bacterium]
ELPVTVSDGSNDKAVVYPLYCSRGHVSFPDGLEFHTAAACVGEGSNLVKSITAQDDFGFESHGLALCARSRAFHVEGVLLSINRYAFAL